MGETTTKQTNRKFKTSFSCQLTLWGETSNTQFSLGTRYDLYQTVFHSALLKCQRNNFGKLPNSEHEYWLPWKFWFIACLNAFRIRWFVNSKILTRYANNKVLCVLPAIKIKWKEKVVLSEDWSSVFVFSYSHHMQQIGCAVSSKFASCAVWNTF